MPVTASPPLGPAPSPPVSRAPVMLGPGGPVLGAADSPLSVRLAVGPAPRPGGETRAFHSLISCLIPFVQIKKNKRAQRALERSHESEDF